MKPDEKWDRRFLDLAAYVSEWSKDPSIKCGAVITDPYRRIVSLGFNGLPRYIEDTDERLYNKELKHGIILHCEHNAILFSRSPILGCTIYTWPFMSCSRCASLIIQAGLTRCVAPSYIPEHYIESCTLAKNLYYEAGIELTLLEVESAPK